MKTLIRLLKTIAYTILVCIGILLFLSIILGIVAACINGYIEEIFLGLAVLYIAIVIYAELG